MSTRTVVQGLRINADKIIPEEVQLDSSFEEVPIAAAAGIPLFVKKLKAVSVRTGNRYIICRMMSEPKTGLAEMHWQYGGSFNPAPQVLVARTDSIPFTRKDWKVLDQFEMEMLNDGPRKVTRADFISFVKNRPCSDENIVLEVLYPRGQRIRVVGLSTNVTLNERIGSATGNYANGRVGVQIDDHEGVVAVKPGNLSMLA